MRSGRQAVVFAFTWTLALLAPGWSSPLAHAAAPGFLQDCAQGKTSPGAQTPMVLGSRGTSSASLVVAMGQRGIFETRDGGTTWDQLTPMGMCHQLVRAFWDNTPDGDMLCVTTQTQHPHNAYCSFDRGNHWQAQTWIKDAVHVLFDPSDPMRAFGWAPTNHCDKVCAGPTYAIAMPHIKSPDRLCGCDMQLAHTAGANPRLYILRDTDTSGQNRLVSLSRDMERETLLIREIDPNIRMLHVQTNPMNDASFLVTIAERTPMGEETGLCCDALYETNTAGRTRVTVPLLFGPLESVVFTNEFGDIAALAHVPHAPEVGYIARKAFGDTNWLWSRAPEAHGQLLRAGDTLYFAGKHLYRIEDDKTAYTIIDPVY